MRKLIMNLKVCVKEVEKSNSKPLAANRKEKQGSKSTGPHESLWQEEDAVPALRVLINSTFIERNINMYHDIRLLTEVNGTVIREARRRSKIIRTIKALHKISLSRASAILRSLIMNTPEY